MTDTIRDLLISLASHVAYMQAQLEARHELDDPEDYYWYRESVLLRQKVTDALADGPAVPEGREPASVVSEPTYDDLSELCSQHGLDVDSWPLEKFDALWETARAVLTRWGTSNFAETRSSLGGMPTPVPADKGEVAESVRWLRSRAGIPASPDFPAVAAMLTRAADLLEQRHPEPVPVSERLPGPEDCDAEGRCWWWYPEVPGKTYGYWAHEDDAVPERAFNEQPLHWLPAHALPLPGQEVEE